MAYIRGFITGAYIRGHISGGLYPRDLYPWILSGVTYQGTFIQWLIARGLISGGIRYTGGLYSMDYIRGTYIWVLISQQISGELIYGELYLENLYPVAYVRGLKSGGLYPGILPGVTYPGTFIQWLITRGLISG